MNLGFFGPKMAVSWRTSAFQKKGPETPIFIVFFGCALSGPRCQKRENLKSDQEKWKNLTDNWKAIFWYFCCFFGGFFFFAVFLFFLFFLYFLFFCFFCFFWRVLGSGEVAQRATSLGPKPSLFVFLVLFFFLCFLFSFFSFFISLCFGKCQKLSLCFGPFFGNFWLMFKKHYKNRYFSTFLKSQNFKKKWQF